jgi:hypothetical protein
MLYPSSLVACDERFGSWMVQYGYANYVTPEKSPRARPSVGLRRVGHSRWPGAGSGRSPSCSNPFLHPGIASPSWTSFVSRGGRLIWSGPAPRLDLAGTSVLERWKSMVGARQLLWERQGLDVAGSTVRFEGTLGSVPPQTVLTDFLVDHAYPVEPSNGAECVARLAGQCVGTLRSLGKGRVMNLGFRPRDDQAASLGEEVRTWFEILRAFGSYPGTGKVPGRNDDPSVISRESDWLATQFPNGTVCLATHYRRHVESWPGGFHRDAAKDAEILRANPLAPEALDIRDLPVAGHRIGAYQGRRLLAFRTRAVRHQIRLEAFAGYDCRGLTLDVHPHEFAERPLPFLAWAPVTAERRVEGGALAQVWIQGQAKVRVPLPAVAHNATRLVAAGRQGTLGAAVPARFVDGWVEFEAHWPTHATELYVLA